ncbi:MAG: thermonuclease family protein [Anaerolineales bacterium]|nr:thermonuclease family protein [Anaerolineales bacterium]
MPKLNIFWDPEGVKINSIGDNRLLKVSDGDTPTVSMAIRMLSIDTPEVHYPGLTKTSRHNAKLQQLAEWIRQGKAPVSDGLAAHLHPRLASGTAGTLQEEQGRAAGREFQRLLEEKLKRPSGRRRNVFLRTADQPFDQYGRLLAYVAPYYTGEELATMTRKERATFNLLMVESGWAAPMMIYPSLPSYPDLVLLHDVARDAYENKRGAWADPLTLTGYEFRMCYRLAEVTEDLVNGKKLTSAQRNGWVERYCADLTTQQIYYPQDYYKVPAYNRLFIWPKDVNAAVSRLNLLPGD